MKRSILAELGGLALVLAGCAAPVTATPPPEKVRIEDVIKNPNGFLGKSISLDGVSVRCIAQTLHIVSSDDGQRGSITWGLGVPNGMEYVGDVRVKQQMQITLEFMADNGLEGGSVLTTRTYPAVFGKEVQRMEGLNCNIGNTTSDISVTGKIREVNKDGKGVMEVTGP